MWTEGEPVEEYPELDEMDCLPTLSVAFLFCLLPVFEGSQRGFLGSSLEFKTRMVCAEFLFLPIDLVCWPS